MNLASLVAEVGRSSNISSSLPSPKKRFRCGLVSVFFAAASRASSRGATSARLEVFEGVSGIKALDKREKDLGG